MTIVRYREVAHQVWVYTLRCQDCGWERRGVKESMLRGPDITIENRVKCCRIPMASGIESAKLAILKSYQNNARRHGRSFALTNDQFWALISEPCFYCGAPPIRKIVRTKQTLRYNGVDRVDSKGGYTPDNVVACCWTCNMAKRAREQGEFIDWIKRCAEYLRDK